MANKHRGYVHIDLDRPRNLKFDMNAIAELEDAIGKPVSQINQLNVGVKELRAMLWAGLLHEDPKLTLRGVGALVDLERVQEITSAVTEALQLAFGKGKDSKNTESGLNGTGQAPNA